MDVAVQLTDAVQQVQRADDVVVLGVDGVGAVDHRVRRGTLLGEVHDRVGRELPQRRVHEIGVEQITDVGGEPLSGVLLPRRHPGGQVFDRHQAAHAEFVVVTAPGEVVEHRHVMSAIGQMQCSGPSEVSVTAEHENSQNSHPFRRW